MVAVDARGIYKGQPDTFPVVSSGPLTRRLEAQRGQHVSQPGANVSIDSGPLTSRLGRLNAVKVEGVVSWSVVYSQGEDTQKLAGVRSDVVSSELRTTESLFQLSLFGEPQKVSQLQLIQRDDSLEISRAITELNEALVRSALGIERLQLPFPTEDTDTSSSVSYRDSLEQLAQALDTLHALWPQQDLFFNEPSGGLGSDQSESKISEGLERIVQPSLFGFEPYPLGGRGWRIVYSTNSSQEPLFHIPPGLNRELWEKAEKRKQEQEALSFGERDTQPLGKRGKRRRRSNYLNPDDFVQASLPWQFPKEVSLDDIFTKVARQWRFFTQQNDQIQPGNSLSLTEIMYLMADVRLFDHIGTLFGFLQDQTKLTIQEVTRDVGNVFRATQQRVAGYFSIGEAESYKEDQELWKKADMVISAIELGITKPGKVLQTVVHRAGRLFAGKGKMTMGQNVPLAQAVRHAKSKPEVKLSPMDFEEQILANSRRLAVAAGNRSAFDGPLRGTEIARILGL